MTSIGSQIQEAQTSEKINPIQDLRAIINQMEADLKWYRQKYPDADISKKQTLIDRLSTICRELDKFQPLEPWRIIWDRLNEAKKQDFPGDIALVYFPLKPNLPAYHETKQVIVDLCGYNLDPYAYDYCKGKLCTSWINDEEGQP